MSRTKSAPTRYSKRKRASSKASPRKRSRTTSSTKTLVNHGKKSRNAGRKAGTGSLTGVPKKSGSKHWLSFGASLRGGKGKSFIKKIGKIVAPAFAISTYSARIPVSPNSQEVVDITAAYTPYDLQNFNSQTPIYAGSTTGVAQPVTTRVLLESCSQKIIFTNNSSSAAFMDLYDIVARKDIAENYANAFTPGTAMNTGLVAESAGAGSGDTATAVTWGWTPFASEIFTQFYKVKRVTRINLASGETCEHITHHAPMRLYNHAVDAVMNEATSLVQDQNSVAKLTHWVMAIAYGSPAGNDGGTNVVMANAEIDYVVTKQYKFSSVAANATTARQIINLPTVETPQIIVPGVTGTPQSISVV